MTLTKAPAHIQLAVDLIELLETNQVKTTDVLSALEIIRQDYLKKLASEATQSSQ